ncbi:hypothetical protein MYP_292 [Sporocytophaga myxococcoides]|uniref:Secretion system C-terminal sorting domain-containing protein n=1 Tax=Sporocytophaga myxococcoides TaxID=153721 RepID=A0A098L8I3_9BACT|nr:T9SS type A sorting domain-containing protein [Sporocytophaga myxococcoides]GAL83066.1 hypothetical protein MYP_292 [Sporocytophaga myxococcoides]
MVKKQLFILIFLAISLTAFCQDTLRNIRQDEKLIAYRSDYGGYICGYLTGQNCWFSENYAEKYRIKGKAEVLGVISYHTGYMTRPNRQVTFDIWSVGANHLPEDSLGGRYMSYRNLIISGNPVTTLFYEPISVEDSFFVAFNFLLYAHDAEESGFTDTLALLTSLDGSRPDSDLADIGRNAVRFHHGQWRDLYQRLGYKFHLALFPIIRYIPVAGTIDYKEAISSLSVYPNPCVDEALVSFSTGIESNVRIKIYNLDQKELMNIDLGRKNPGFHHEKLNVSSLHASVYILSIESDYSRQVYKFIKGQ